MSDMVSFDTRDIEKMIKTLNKLGKSPQKAVNKGASKGMTAVRRSVRKLVPVGETGNLKRGLRRQGERSRVRGKKVYQLTFSSSMNDIFQKPVKNPGEAGSKSTAHGHAYYPASMEYGFLTRSKGNGLSYVPGYEFMKTGAESAAPEARRSIINTVMEELRKIWLSD